MSRSMSAWLRRGLLLSCCLLAWPSLAFCGFYVSSADTRLYNRASQVALLRDGTHTVMTLANDFRGDVRDFAIVVPVPSLLRRGQIHVADPALLEHLDAYTAPRLVQYFDEDPCAPRVLNDAMPAAGVMYKMEAASVAQRARSLGVHIEARYAVGEYDILILSARDSRGLGTWLRENGYRIPAGAEPVVQGYLKQGMHFFVARVNLKAQAAQLRVGFTKLRPLQIAYDHPRFMLPIRLGMVNADGPQELFVYGLSRSGRIETTNYRTVALPTDVNLPEFVQPEFADFYRAMFREQTRKWDGEVVFLEYGWDTGWCDPCAADPLRPDELKQLGAFWLDGSTGASNLYVTRLHVRYDATHFPEDLQFQETGNRTNFQGRYVLQRAWRGRAACPEARRYFAEALPGRRELEVQALAQLTGWDVAQLRRRLPAIPELREPEPARPVPAPARPATPARTPEAAPWWKQLWP